MAAAVASGGHPDPRDAQITRLKAELTTLKTRCGQQDQAITALQDQRTLALSRLAAQHDEIHRLRTAAAGTGNVRDLRTAPHQGTVRALLTTSTKLGNTREHHKARRFASAGLSHAATTLPIGVQVTPRR